MMQMGEALNRSERFTIGAGLAGRLGAVVVALALWLAALPAVAQEAANAIESVSVSSLSGERVQIKFTMSQPASEPLSFTIDNPARIALDFASTSSKLPSRKTEIGVGVARSVNVVEARGRTRAVLNLVRLVPYELKVEGNDVYVILEQDSGASKSVMVVPAADKPATATFTSGKQVAAAHEVTNVDFRRGEEGEARILVSLSDTGVGYNIRPRGGKLVIDFYDTTLPAELEQSLDVTDFATPVTTVETFRQGDNVRMVIDTSDDFEHLAYQSDELLTIEIKKKEKPTLEARRKAGDESAFSGERLSLNFQNIEVRAVLQLIADFTGMNLVTSDTVTGELTLRLQNIPWDQALDIILRTKGLDMRQMGNVIYIAPAEEIAARETAELEAKRQVEELEPLYSDLVQINYAKASDIADLLKAEGNSLLSPRGTVTVDERTNTLLINDISAKLDEIRKLIEVLDVPVKQVLIESRIVIANSSFNKELGVRFGITRDSGGSQTTGDSAIVSGNLSAIDNLADNEPIDINNDALNVNLPVQNPAGQIAIALAKLPLGTLLDLELSALQAEGKGEVISTPRLITANQKEAFIEQGVEIPYQKATSSGATSVSFKKAVMSLRVTPHITPDDRIIMDLVINKDSVGEVFQNVPSINTREINTQVLAENGETIVLGGIYEQSSNRGVNRVPFFGDLPLVGALFRSTTKRDAKEELLIFITPKIIKEGMTLQ